MITVRTKKKIGMGQMQLTGRQEENFVVSLGQDLLDFVEKYSEVEDYESSLLYATVDTYVKNKDVDGIKKLFKGLQLFGTYDKNTGFTTKYKNISTACGLTYNGTVYEGRPDEQSELERIVAHTCAMCSKQGDEFVEKLLA